MKVAYSNSRLITNFLFGIFWIGTRIYDFIGDEKFKWLDYAFLAIGIVYLTGFFIEYYMKYFSYDEFEISLFGWRKKTIRWKDLTEIKYFGETYTFRTLNTVIQINKVQMNKNSRQKFNNFFEERKIKFDKSQLNLI